MFGRSRDEIARVLTSRQRMVIVRDGVLCGVAMFDPSVINHIFAVARSP